MEKADFDAMNQAVIEEFRTTGGKAGGVFTSKGGADRDPDWYRNLVAHPQITVELGTETYQASARVLEGDERDEIYAKQVEVEPQFGDYQSKTSRLIPVVELVRS